MNSIQKINTKVNIIIPGILSKKTLPIDIPCKGEHRNDIQIPNKIYEKYTREIKLNLIDPNKSSPPNSWNSRLLMRVLNM